MVTIVDADVDGTSQRTRNPRTWRREAADVGVCARMRSGVYRCPPVIPPGERRDACACACAITRPRQRKTADMLRRRGVAPP